MSLFKVSSLDSPSLWLSCMNFQKPRLICMVVIFLSVIFYHSDYSYMHIPIGIYLSVSEYYRNMSMNLNKVVALCMGIFLITGIFTGALIMRPVWMKTRVALNNTVYRQNEAKATEVWLKLKNTVDSSFWLIPAVGVFIVVAWIYMSMQEKEYVGSGYYR